MTDVLRLNRPPRFGIRTLGYGDRAVIWTQGCTLHCAGCASRDTWPASGGAVWSVPALVEAVLAHPADGLTITGGEPFQQPDGLAALLSAVRRREPEGFDILCYSGYRIESLRARHGAILEGLDVLVDGRYREDLSTDLPLRGSHNQRLHRLSPLGRLRYADGDEPGARPALQFILEDTGIELVGVPAPGELAALERRMAAEGLTFGEASWRG